MIERHTLKNGLRVVAQNRPDSLATCILILVKTGSRNENSDIHGMSHFLEHMASKGTKKRPTAQIIAREIDGMGAYSNAFTNKEYTGFYIKCDYTKFEKSLEILTDTTFNSTIDIKELEKEKGTIIEEINRRQDDPETLKLELFENIIFQNSFLSQNILGSKGIIKSITSVKMKDYHKKYYKAGNIILSIVGRLPKNYMDIIDKNLSLVQKGTEKYIQTKKENPLFKKNVLLKKRDTAQSHVVLGVNAFPKKNLNTYPSDLLSVILGGNNSSRLWIKIREEKGLAYDIEAYNESGFDNGVFAIYGGINNESVFDALRIIKEEILSISKNITIDELVLAKNFVRGMISLREENSTYVTESNAIEEMLGVGALTTKDKIKLYEKVTLDEVKRVAEDLFKPEKMKLAVIGPFKDEEKFVKILGS